MSIITQVGVTGTWTPTFTGFSTPPTITGTCIWELRGNVCTCSMRALATAGTSNANTFTITLPFPAATNAGVQFGFCQILDNTTTTAIGKIITRSNSNIADLAPSVTGGLTSWTTTNLKTCAFTFTYIIQP